MRRYLITLVDDPTLAAQAHAAILALPGVVGVEEVPEYTIGVDHGAGPDWSALVRFAREGGVLRIVDDLPPYTPPPAGTLLSPDDAAIARAHRVPLRVYRGSAQNRVSGYPAGWIVVAPEDVPGPPYTVADEDDGAP